MSRSARIFGALFLLPMAFAARPLAGQSEILTLEQIVKHPQPMPETGAGPFVDPWKDLECSLRRGSACDPAAPVPASGAAPATRDLAQPISIGAGAGAKVKRVLVRRYRDQPGFDWPAVQQALVRLWSQRTSHVTNQIDWAEGNLWNVYAEIEFDGTSRRGSLLTDGHHVQLLDASGRYWFTRVPSSP